MGGRGIPPIAIVEQSHCMVCGPGKGYSPSSLKKTVLGAAFCILCSGLEGRGNWAHLTDPRSLLILGGPKKLWLARNRPRAAVGLGGSVSANAHAGPLNAGNGEMGERRTFEQAGRWERTARVMWTTAPRTTRARSRAWTWPPVVMPSASLVGCGVWGWGVDPRHCPGGHAASGGVRA